MKYEAGFKCKVIEFAKENSNRAAARKFNVNECVIRGWRKNEAVITMMPKGKCALRKAKAKWPILEKTVANWVIENRQKGLNITRNNIRLYALKWAKMNKNDSVNFKATVGWCDRFMNRQNIVLREKIIKSS